MVAFNDVLKQQREASGKNMRQMAKIIGIPYTTYVNYEKGEREPSYEMLVQLANILGVSVDFLLSGCTEIAKTTLPKGDEKQMDKYKDKLVFKPKFFSESRNVRVRLTDDAADIVNGLWLRTGLSATEIVSRMVEFAAERVEVEKTAFDE